MSSPPSRLKLAVLTAPGRFLHWAGFLDAKPAVWFAALPFFKLTLVPYHLFKERRFICRSSKELPLFCLTPLSKARLNFCFPSQEPCATFTNFTVSAAFLLSASGPEHPPRHAIIAKASPSPLFFFFPPGIFRK